MAPIPKIAFDEEKMSRIPDDLREKIVAACPAWVFKNDPENLEGIEIENLAACMLCEECVKCAKQASTKEFNLDTLIKVGTVDD